MSAFLIYRNKKSNENVFVLSQQHSSIHWPSAKFQRLKSAVRGTARTPAPGIETFLYIWSKSNHVLRSYHRKTISALLVLDLWSLRVQLVAYITLTTPLQRAVHFSFASICHPPIRTEFEMSSLSVPDSSNVVNGSKRMKATGVFCVVPICGLAAFPIR